MNKRWYVAGLVVLIVFSLVFIFWNAQFRSDKKNPHSAQLKLPEALPTKLPERSPEKLLPVKIKRAVNQALAPEGATYPKIENAQGITIDVSQRAVSVSTALIDENGKLHIVDYTSPIKE